MPGYQNPVPAGALDRRIVVERFAADPNNPVLDNFNNPIKQWSTYAELWAQKMDISDAERLQSQEIGSELASRFRVRWSETTAAITGKDRLRYNGLIYDILAIKDLDRRVGIEITTIVRQETVQG